MPDNPHPVTTVGILSEIGAGNASEVSTVCSFGDLTLQATMAVRYHSASFLL